MGARHSAECVSQQVLEQGGLEVLGVVMGDKAMVQLASAALQAGPSLPYSLAEDSDADQIGLIFMARAGESPAGDRPLAEHGEAGGGGSIELSSTDPSDENPIERLQALMPWARPNTRPGRSLALRSDGVDGRRWRGAALERCRRAGKKLSRKPTNIFLSMIPIRGIRECPASVDVSPTGPTETSSLLNLPPLRVRFFVLFQEAGDDQRFRKYTHMR